MRSRLIAGEKPLDWIGSTKRDLLAFPAPVRREIGNALGLAQFGGKHPKAKPWKGEGPGVFEVVDDFDGDTYRAVYTVRFRQVVYVLHAFQKKSPRGSKTARTDIDLIARRLMIARQDYEARYDKSER
jgi:phage-related protein